ncbi:MULTISPECIES: hypothetical protein [unclassified Micromonospora]|uniref:hypothetical protein n=1 Tax=unclassified Micromonospora TaxID=2617518 RepID=UPI003319FC1F
MTVWRWEATDPHGTVQIADTLSDPFATTAEQAAETGMARLMIRAAPSYRRLRGWRVRAWADGLGEASVCADDWLRADQESRGLANSRP